MDRSDVIKLFTQSYAMDEIGQQIAAETAREVFCNVGSVSRAEWFDAGRNGMKPQYKVTMFAPDYAGETIAEYGGKRYGVYRTYLGQNETVELYLEQKGGVENAECKS